MLEAMLTWKLLKQPKAYDAMNGVQGNAKNE
jgi:hypothetical protein